MSATISALIFTTAAPDADNSVIFTLCHARLYGYCSVGFKVSWLPLSGELSPQVTEG